MRNLKRGMQDEIGRRDRDMLRFEGGKGDRRSIGRIII